MQVCLQLLQMSWVPEWRRRRDCCVRRWRKSLTKQVNKGCGLEVCVKTPSQGERKAPKPSVTMRRFPPYSQIADPFQRRRAIVQLHSEGWNIKTIALYMQTLRNRVYEILRRWVAEGFAGLDDKSHAPTIGHMNSVMMAATALRRSSDGTRGRCTHSRSSTDCFLLLATSAIWTRKAIYDFSIGSSTANEDSLMKRYRSGFTRGRSKSSTK